MKKPSPSIFLPDWLGRCAENNPEQMAVQCEQERWSFAELDRRVTELARRLATLGVQEGKRVALLAANGLPYVALVHALTRLGAVLVPLNRRLTIEELCWQLHDVRASLLVCDDNDALLAAEIRSSMPSLPVATLGEESKRGEVVLSQLPAKDVSLRTLIDLDAAQAIMYTSGTTGQPKGAIITYGMLWWNAVGSALNLGHRLDDRWLACLPLYHIGGLSILMRSVIYGISVVIHKKFDPASINRSIFEDDITIISVVAVMLQRMLANLDSDWGGESYPARLRCVLLGGGPVPYPLLETCMRRAIPVVQTYGLTESASQAATLSPVDAVRKPGSAGRPLPPVQLRIMHEGGQRPAEPDEPGEIFLKGPTITPGYIGSPEATERAFHDGWFATGDIGYLDKEGYLFVLDRRADLIISGGENIYPAEIESILQAHPTVKEVGVCGLPDGQWGQVPVAFVVPEAGSTISVGELLDYAAQRLARYKRPRAIYPVEQLPRTSSGKLRRRELPELLLSAHGESKQRIDKAE
ncbi:MAG TPA: o-succinylbenzoate--CoA ligase [Ktedonobacteraceae bacterium]|nr:o-succinylbenzoate--CoA ligase [Ktedonobacteraceae bacterium]